MKVCLIFCFVLPFSLMAQIVLDYTNDYINYWAKTNRIEKLTTSYIATSDSETNIQNVLEEELIYNDAFTYAKQFKQFYTIFDTIEYPKIKSLIEKSNPDTSYTNQIGIIRETYSINNKKYYRELSKDLEGALVFEKIFPKGLKPIYLNYLTKLVVFDKEKRVVKAQTNHIFGRNDWEYFFDTLAISTITYSRNIISCITKKQLIDPREDIPFPSHNYSTDTNSLKIIDTTSLNVYDLTNQQLKDFFNTADLNHLVQIVYNDLQLDIGDRNEPSKFSVNQSFEYIDPISNKRIYRKPLHTQHPILLQPNYGTQEIEQFGWGKRIKNFYFNDKSQTLVEIIEIDRKGRMINYFDRHSNYDWKNKNYVFVSDITKKPLGWNKRSFEYVEDYPFIVHVYDQKGNNPEKMAFKKLRKINRYEDWVANHIEQINSTQVKLKIKQEEFLIVLNKK